jgi:hypothetical protein
MKKFLLHGKKFYNRLTKRQKIFFKIGGLFTLLLIAWFIFWGTNSWVILPGKLKAQIAFNKLGVSVYQEPICHENCFYERQFYKKIIASGLKNQKLAEHVQRTILDNQENLNFRLELIATLKIFQATPPDYLVVYANSPQSELKIKEAIMNNFSIDYPEIVDDLVNQIRDASRKEEERLNALIALEGYGDDSLWSFYLGLLENDSSLKVKDQALAALSNLNDQDRYLTAELLERLKTILFSPTTDQYIRKSLVWFMADFLKTDEQAVVKILETIYRNETFDKFSRYWAADILNQATANSYPEPVISEVEWTDYQSHNISAQAFKD